MKRNGLILISTLLITPVSHAFYCSTQGGNGYINIGDSQSMVQSACGAPTSQQKQQVQNNTPNTTQYWTYQNTHDNTAVGLGISPAKNTSNQPGPVIIFKIENGVVTSITQNGLAVTSATGCAGGSVAVGAQATSVSSACGEPGSVSMGDTNNNANAPTQEVTIWTYDQGSYSQPLTLQFDAQGTLKSINGSTSN